MNEKKKHKIMLGIEVVLFCMIVAILGTNAASSNPPSNGVSYGKNSQTTVEGALNDLYDKANYGNAGASQILKDKTALVGGKQVTGTMPSKNGSSKATKVSANASNVYMVFPYGYYPSETHFSTNNSSEVYATNADVASAIGLTASKLLKGQTVLGITGTGETSCPTCESQDYWKVYKFTGLDATCDSSRSGGCLASSWFSSAKDVVRGCNSSGNNCESYDGYGTAIESNLNLNYKEILGYNIVLTCSSQDQSICMRISKAKSATGGADKTTSATYPSVNQHNRYNAISVSRGASVATPFDSNVSTDGFGVGGTSDTTCTGSAYGDISSGKVRIVFSEDCYSNGSHWSNIELKGTSYKLSGYIIYR